MQNERPNHGQAYDDPDADHAAPSGAIALSLQDGAKLSIRITGWPPGEGEDDARFGGGAADRRAGLTPQPRAARTDTGWPPGGPLTVTIDFSQPGGKPQHHVIQLTGWPPGDPKEAVAKPPAQDPEDEPPTREE